jgi:hypothetical protein
MHLNFLIVCTGPNIAQVRILTTFISCVVGVAFIGLPTCDAVDPDPDCIRIKMIQWIQIPDPVQTIDLSLKKRKKRSLLKRILWSRGERFFWSLDVLHGIIRNPRINCIPRTMLSIVKYRYAK